MRLPTIPCKKNVKKCKGTVVGTAPAGHEQIITFLMSAGKISIYPQQPVILA